MIFGDVSVDDAEGAVLAHTTRLPGRVIQKGTRLDRTAVDDMRRAGFSHITAARMEIGDVPEDEAAARLADALNGAGIVRTRTGTGRANLAAAHAGLFRVASDAVHSLNLLHEGLTVSTLPDATPVAAGDLLVTVKIIPFAIPGAALADAETLALTHRPLRLPTFQALRTGLIVTTLPGLKDSLYRSAVNATQRRITMLSGTLLPPLRVEHRQAAIADGLRSLMDAGAELLLIAGASATVDRGDVGPAAISALGGVIEHFGMPVDPGNLICVARLAGIPTLVLPGCARSPKLNGIDLVLARIFAGEPAGSSEIARMGVGGLLKEFVSRPSPRIGKPPQPSRISALVLAAGLSSRMAPDNKLLITDPSGRHMVTRVVAAVVASRAETAHVVVGHQADQIAAALKAQPVTLVHAAEYRSGLAASLKAGIAALPSISTAVLVCLADMPLVTTEHINQIIDGYDPDEGRLIVVPTYRGKRGNPVLWDRQFYADILALTGDAGARTLLLRHAEHVVEVELDSDAILMDFDTPEAAATLL